MPVPTFIVTHGQAEGVFDGKCIALTGARPVNWLLVQLPHALYRLIPGDNPFPRIAHVGQRTAVFEHKVVLPDAKLDTHLFGHGLIAHMNAVIECTLCKVNRSCPIAIGRCHRWIIARKSAVACSDIAIDLKDKQFRGIGFLGCVGGVDALIEG